MLKEEPCYICGGIDTRFCSRCLPQPKRQDWDTYFLQMAVNAASRATCPRLHVGAVAVRGNRVLSTGYNGSLPGEPHCDEVGCLMVEGHCIRTIHAEENAIRNSEGRNPDTLYCTHCPCLYCLKTTLAAGVRRIVYLNHYKPMPVRDEFVKAFTGELTIIQKPLAVL